MTRANRFLANVPILHPLKTPANRRVSGVFRGCKMGTLGILTRYRLKKIIPLTTLRNSHFQRFCKIDVLKNFSIITGKHLYWSLFLINLQPWGSGSLLKRDSNTRCFPVNIVKFLRTDFFLVPWWLLLNIANFLTWVHRFWEH